MCPRKYVEKYPSRDPEERVQNLSARHFTTILTNCYKKSAIKRWTNTKTNLTLVSKILNSPQFKLPMKPREPLHFAVRIIISD